MNKANEDVRNMIKESGIPHWVIAYRMGVSHTTLSVWLRTPLSDEHRRMIETAIEEIKKSEE